MNLPNKLTLARIAMIPFFVVALTCSADSLKLKILAMAIFLLANFTDVLDGYIARSQNMITDFGKILSP